jgi:hypothetical protein
MSGQNINLFNMQSFKVYWLLHVIPVSPSCKDYWFYLRKDGKHGAIVRPIGQIMLNVTVQPLLNGQDRVAAHTLGGNVVFSQDYGMREECAVLEYGVQVHRALIQQNKASLQSHVVLLQLPGSKAIRGKAVIKRAVRPTKDKFKFNFDCKQPRICRSFAKKPAAAGTPSRSKNSGARST